MKTNFMRRFFSLPIFILVTSLAIGHADDPNPYGFNGYAFDGESGLYNTKDRYYDPTIGRFTGQDKYLGDSATPPSLNLYTYGYNNPTRYTDPTGHWPIPINGMVVTPPINLPLITPVLPPESGAGIISDPALEPDPDNARNVTPVDQGISDDGKYVTPAAPPGKSAIVDKPDPEIQKAAKPWTSDLFNGPINGTVIEGADGRNYIRHEFEAEPAITALISIPGKNGNGTIYVPGNIDDIPPSVPAQPTDVKGWKLGDPVNHLTGDGNVPSWSTVRARLWKNEALHKPNEYTAENLD